MPTKKKIAVIGSGFGGLSAAIRLAAQGHEVTIFEKLDRWGGRAYQHEINGFKFDGGPTVITAPHQYDELFDLAPGNLFVIRNAGNVIDDDVLGSLEYGVDHLGITLIVTLGHSLCGAVKATEAVVKGGAMPGHHVDALVNHIKPALTALPANHTLAEAVAANAEQSAKLAESESDVVKEFVDKGELKVVAATYDLVTRKVTFA